MSETQGFLYLGHSNWSIWSQLSSFCSDIFQPFWLSRWGVQLCVIPAVPSREAAPVPCKGCESLQCINHTQLPTEDGASSYQPSEPCAGGLLERSNCVHSRSFHIDHIRSFTTPIAARRTEHKPNKRAFATPIAGRLLLTVNFLPPPIPRSKAEKRKMELTKPSTR